LAFVHAEVLNKTQKKYPGQNRPLEDYCIVLI
jgi:hypothetical protein